MDRSFWFTLASAALAATIGTPVLADIDLRVVAVSGQQVPGLPEGVVFSPFVNVYQSELALSPTGTAVFRNALTGPGITPQNNMAILRARSGSAPSLIVREGDPVPGLDQVFYSTLHLAMPKINAADQVLLNATVSGPGVEPGTSRRLLRLCDAHDPVELMNFGDPVPGLGGDIGFSQFDPHSMLLDDHGRALITSSISGPGVTSENNRVIVRFSESGGSVLARVGDQAPGLPNEVFYSGFQTVYPWISRNGLLGFRSQLAGAGVTPENGFANFAERPDSGTTMVVREGDPATGFPDQTVESLWSRPAIDNDGDVYFFVAAPTGGIPIYRWVLYAVRSTGETEILAEEGTPISDDSDGIHFNAVLGDHRIAYQNNRAVFACYIDDPAYPFAQAVIRNVGPGQNTIAARSGQAVVDVPGGYRLWMFDAGSLRINPAGQISFSATAENGQEDPKGIFLINTDGQLITIAMEGQTIDLNSGGPLPDFRTVWQLSSYTHIDRSQHLNGLLSDEGHVAFVAQFTDGSDAILVATVPPAPQPCPADLAAPFGTLNIFDIQQYLALYNTQDPAADLAEPFGAFNIFDIQQYLSLYNQGCP